MGTVLTWLVEPGARVDKGQPLVQVESDKAIVELEAPCSGLVLSTGVREGEAVEAGHVLAVIGVAGEAIGAPVPVPIANPGADKPQSAAPAKPGRPSRLARPARKQRQPALAHVPQAGPLRGAGQQIVPLGAGDELPPHAVLPLPAIRARIGENLLASLRAAPHAFVEVEADVTPLVRWRQEFASAYVDERPSYTALFVQAAAQALRGFPDLNASIRGASLYRWKAINIGVAVARQDGLIVPVIPDADQRSLADIMGRLRSFGSSHVDPLPGDAACGGTFTVSNLGMHGADSVLSVIHPGQAGILSLGRIRPKPVAEADRVVIRSVVRMTLAFDHRILDGAMAAQFLARLETLFTAPESWAG